MLSANVKSEVKPESGDILVTFTVMPDGFGDGGHGRDFYNTLKGYLASQAEQRVKVFILMMCFADKKVAVVRYLKNQGMLSAETSPEDNWKTIHDKNKHVFLFSVTRLESEKDNDETPVYDDPEHFEMLASAEFREVRHVRNIFNVSNASLLRVLTNPRYGYNKIFDKWPRVTHFPEHGCAQGSVQEYGVNKVCPMGLEHGLFLNPPEMKSREEVLCSLSDTKLLANMLGCSEKAGDQQKLAAAKQFFAENEVFSCYYKFPNSFLLYLLAYVGSPLCMDSGKKGIVVYTNIYYLQERDTIDFTNAALLQYLYCVCKIKTVSVTTEKGTVTCDLRKELTEHGDIFKVGVPREDDKEYAELKIFNQATKPDDFERLFAITSGIGGCSGDKSWESLVQMVCAVFPEFRAYKFAGSAAEILRVFVDTYLAHIIQESKQTFGHGHGRSNTIWHMKSEGGVKKPIIEWLTSAQVIELAVNFSKHITAASVQKVRDVIANKILKERNLFKLLPDIFQREIQAALTPAASVVPFSQFQRKRKTTAANPAPEEAKVLAATH